MKVTGLDNKVYHWSWVDCVPSEDDERPRSSFHLRARRLLHNTFPCDRILEEVFLPGSGGLYADFYVPAYSLLIEVHGQQHYEFTNFFHNHITKFYSAKKRDKAKKQWAEKNNIEYIEFPEYEDDNEWYRRLTEERQGISGDS